MDCAVPDQAVDHPYRSAGLHRANAPRMASHGGPPIGPCHNHRPRPGAGDRLAGIRGGRDRRAFGIRRAPAPGRRIGGERRLGSAPAAAAWRGAHDRPMGRSNSGGIVHLDSQRQGYGGIPVRGRRSRRGLPRRAGHAFRNSGELSRRRRARRGGIQDRLAGSARGELGALARPQGRRLQHRSAGGVEGRRWVIPLCPSRYASRLGSGLARRAGYGSPAATRSLGPSPSPTRCLP